MITCKLIYELTYADLLYGFLQFLSKLTLSLLLNQRLILNLRKVDELNILEN